MTNLELAEEKLAAARLILGAVDSYLATADRLNVEARKLADEAGKLLEGEYGTTIEASGQGQRTTPQSSDALEALPGCVPSDASA